MNRYTLRLDDDGSGRYVGVETGDLQLVAYRRHESVIVLHEAGHHYWNRIGGPWPYAPARWHVLHVDSVTRRSDGTLELDLTHLIDFPVSGNADFRSGIGSDALDSLTRDVLND